MAAARYRAHKPPAQQPQAQLTAATAAAAAAAKATDVKHGVPWRLVVAGALESFFFLLEFMLGTVLLRDALRFVGESVASLLGAQLPWWSNVIFYLASTGAMVLWSLFRLARATKSTELETARKIGALRVQVTGLTLAVMLLHLLGSTLLLLWQHSRGRWIFSWGNYYDDEGKLRHTNVIDMLLVAPLREELLFRGVILTIARERLGDSPYRERLAALTSTACFSVIHLMNAGAGRYSMDYVALQVVLGFVMGLFFALRALQTRSLWETAALHLVNNVFASMLPFDVEVDLRDPIFALPLLQTLVTYALLDAHLWRKVDQAARASD